MYNFVLIIVLEVDKIYNKLKEVHRRVKETRIIDYGNAKIDEWKEEGIIEGYGLEKRNQRGDKMIEFCEL